MALIFLFILLGGYSILAVLLSRNLRPVPESTKEWQPVVSVVIACRNEEHNLPGLFDSLRHLDYPRDKLEIILVDDASTDDTGSLIAAFEKSMAGVTTIALAPGEKEKSGKAGALLAGIELSRGEIIFITDADCRVAPHWIRSLLPALRENIGVVGGYTVIDSPARLFARVQALDWQLLLCVAAAASQMTRPITWVGNNLAFRRCAYDAVGGYRGLPNSFVEDFALIDAIERRTTYGCRFYAENQGAVRTRAAASLKQLYHQRKRWAFGITGARPFGLLIMSTAFFTHLFLVIVFLMQPFCGVAALLLKTWSDLRLLSKKQSTVQTINPWLLMLFEIYYILYSLVLPLLFLLDRRVVWKGEMFRSR